MSKALERVPVRLQSNVQPNAVMEDNKVASRRLDGWKFATLIRDGIMCIVTHAGKIIHGTERSVTLFEEISIVEIFLFFFSMGWNLRFLNFYNLELCPLFFISNIHH